MTIFTLPYGLLSEWMCLVASILLLKKVIPKFWRTFIPYLTVIVATETLCFTMRVLSFSENNHTFYNGSLIVMILFYLYVFNKILKLPSMVGYVSLIILSCIYTIEGFYINFAAFLSLTNSIFHGFVVILCIIYYFKLFKQDEYQNILILPEFWFVTGCFIFSGTATGLNAFFDVLSELSEQYRISFRYIIINILSVIMYSCWIKSFLCLKKNQVYSPR